MICDNIAILAKNIGMTLIRPIHPKWADRYDFIMREFKNLKQHR